MTSLDILFWLLIVMLGGVAWAIEAGLTARHRNVLLSTTVSVFASGVFIMFWLPDDSVLELAARPKTIKRQASSGERGQFEYETVGKKKPKGEEQDEEEGKEEGGETPGDAEEPVAGPAEKPEYSMYPMRDCPRCPEMVILTPKLGVGELAKAFAIGRLEVLRKEFEIFVKDAKYDATDNCDIGTVRKGKYSWRTPGFEQDPRHPVVCVTHEDAEAYVKWLTKLTGRPYSLPSRDRWDFAARAGTHTVYWQGAKLSSGQANFGRSRDGTIPAGSLPANKFGLSDVSGNVSEILSTCHRDADFQLIPGQPVPRCHDRIVKGGAWNSTAEQLRSDAILSVPLAAATNSIGFRVAREVDERDDNKILTKDNKAELVAAEQASVAMRAKEKADAENAEREKLEAEYKVEQEKIAAEVKAKGGKK